MWSGGLAGAARPAASVQQRQVIGEVERDAAVAIAERLHAVQTISPAALSVSRSDGR